MGTRLFREVISPKKVGWVNLCFVHVGFGGVVVWLFLVWFGFLFGLFGKRRDQALQCIPMWE